MEPTLTVQEFSAPPSMASVAWNVSVHVVGPGDTPYAYRAVPDGSVHLRYRIGDQLMADGPMTRPRELALPAGSVSVGVRLKPGIAGRLLGLPASELIDNTVPVAQLSGRWIGHLCGQLADADDAHAVVTAFGLHLSARSATMVADREIEHALRALLPQRPRTIAQVASAAGLSPRHLRRRFDDAVGLSPKVLQRQWRFQKVLAALQSALALDQPADKLRLGDLAASCGYTDQSHLNRDCNELTGTSVSRFLRSTAHRCRTGHEHAAAYAPLR